MRPTLIPFTLVALAACDPRAAAGAGDAPYQTAMSAAGDTVVATTTGDVPTSYLRHLTVEWRASGDPFDTSTTLGDVNGMAVAPDGRVLVWDPVTPALWLYGADGTRVTRVSRKGAGPGEYDRVNGVTVRPDGKLIVWDAGNARLNVYDGDGVPVTSWKLPMANTFTSNGIASDTRNRIWVRSSVRKQDEPWENARLAWFRWDSAGATFDTVLAPTYEGNDPPLVARRQDAGGTSTSSNSIPFGRVATFTVSTRGVLIAGPGKPYIVHTEIDGKPLRIVRDWTPVPIPDAERQQRRALTEWSLRQTQANWVWDGPDIPAEKPPYAGFSSGLDGRIWVQLYAASEPFEPEPSATTDANPRPVVRFRATERRWDVFEPSGRYVGRLVASRLFTPYAMRGDSVWGVLRDEDDVPAIVKMRIDPKF